MTKPLRSLWLEPGIVIATCYVWLAYPSRNRYLFVCSAIFVWSRQRGRICKGGPCQAPPPPKIAWLARGRGGARILWEIDGSYPSIGEGSQSLAELLRFSTVKRYRSAPCDLLGLPLALAAALASFWR